MEYILRTQQLTKAYNGHEVVRQVNMNIRPGEIYGFLGPNAAGKTTVMRMIMNLVKPTSGEVELFGQAMTGHSYEMFKRMGSIIEYPVFYDKLSARENLMLHGEYMGYYDPVAAKEALELVKLGSLDNKPVKQLSLGMKQRLGIARAIMTRPELLILDEPINGLDPAGIRELREIFRMLSREYGMTLLISSHILGEMEQIADTIGVIHQGRLAEEVSMAAIRDQQTAFIELVTADTTRAAYVLESKLNLGNFKIIEPNTIRIYDGDITTREIGKMMALEDIELDSLNKKQHSLEDYFLQLTGGEHIA